MKEKLIRDNKKGRNRDLSEMKWCEIEHYDKDIENAGFEIFEDKREEFNYDFDIE